MTYDCIIVGGGPAGLSAALILGRARRRVLVVDAGSPRNHCSASMHGYLTRDGLSPAGFLRIGREQLGPYEAVELRDGDVDSAARTSDGFSVGLKDGTSAAGRTLLLCTGVVDDIPVIEGIDRFYGRTVHHCPYCDGWEHRDTPVAVYGCGDKAAKYALSLTVWTRDIVLCTDGFPGIETDVTEHLLDHGILIQSERIVRLEGKGDRLERLVFADGSVLARSALFFCTSQHQRSGLAADLGCRFTEAGAVATGRSEGTNVPGLFVAGDASRDAQLVIVAASEGAQAGVTINNLLTRLDLERVPRS